MSCWINGTEITLTRGDTMTTEVGITSQDGTAYTPVEGDTIRFALKRNALQADNKSFVDREPLILKSVPIDTMVLILEPADTKPLAFGDYVYDMELTHADGSVDTFIPVSRFTIAKEVD